MTDGSKGGSGGAQSPSKGTKLAIVAVVVSGAVMLWLFGKDTREASRSAAVPAQQTGAQSGAPSGQVAPPQSARSGATPDASQSDVAAQSASETVQAATDNATDSTTDNAAGSAQDAGQGAATEQAAASDATEATAAQEGTEQGQSAAPQAQSDLATAPDQASPQPPETSAQGGEEKGMASAQPPSFDVVRIEPNGAALIAGRAGAGEVLRIMAGDRVLSEVTADASGRFVAFAQIADMAAGQVLGLEVERGGSVLRSAGQVIVAPRQPQVAQAESPAGNAVQGIDKKGENSGGASAEQGGEPTAEQSAQGSPEQSAQQSAAPADTAPAVLISDAAGLRVLQPAERPESGVSLDVISYRDDGAVRLAGQGTAGGRLRVYLDSRAVAEAQIGGDGAWQLDIEGIDSGIYTLRVDHLAADGTVISRVETPFKREAPARIASAAQQAAEAATRAEPQSAQETSQASGAAGAAAQEGSAPAQAPQDQTAAAQTAQTSTSAATARSEGDGDTQSAATANAPETPPVTASVSASGGQNSAQQAATPPAEPEQEQASVAAQDPTAKPASTTASTPASTLAPAPAAAPTQLRVVTVQPGSTLWEISSQNYGEGVEYMRIFNANRAQIRDPDLIYPGQVFDIPVE
ncbi:LysM peptidoglycan-binding domain-containing protein [Litorivita sp. NS0012-18]|uniref:LysM peptidoglycan-binding domain-containing protein n=1 Tax=Litorivita sp. NS0012-18 TaxID=3127655 RepID=UPI0033413BB4